MPLYDLVLSEDAARFLAQASRTAQRRLGVILDHLKAGPFRPGDLQERDAQGRICEILVVGDWIVTLWVDHAVREIRVLRLESVED